MGENLFGSLLFLCSIAYQVCADKSVSGLKFQFLETVWKINPAVKGMEKKSTNFISPLGFRKRVWYICCVEYVEHKWCPKRKQRKSEKRK